MEKTVRVCDECGAEKEHTPWWGECIICGKDLCDDCASFLFDRESLSIALCPAHYKQVREFIEGLKPPPWVTEDRGQYYEVRGKASCIRNGAFEWDDCRIHVRKDAADALYEYMRRERD